MACPTLPPPCSQSPTAPEQSARAAIYFSMFSKERGEGWLRAYREFKWALYCWQRRCRVKDSMTRNHEDHASSVDIMGVEADFKDRAGPAKPQQIPAKTKDDTHTRPPPSMTRWKSLSPGEMRKGTGHLM